MHSQANSLAVFCKPSTMTKRVLLGIASYLQKHEKWNLSPFESQRDVNGVMNARDFVGTIVIDPGYCNGNLVSVLEGTIPLVVVGCHELRRSIPSIAINDVSVAKIAAIALLDRGFHSLAFVGEMSHRNSKALQLAFCDELRSKGIAPFIFMSHSSSSEGKDAIVDQQVMRRRLMEWLSSLPAETGVFAADDNLAFEVYKVATRLRLSIPEDLAILGVNDDDLLCKIMRPSLSSIRLPFEKMGYDAASQLSMMIHSKTLTGKGNERNYTSYEPMGLIARGSTKAVVVKDPVAKAAVSFIHENFMNPINVESILEELQVSRSLLERRFRDELGVTPLVELRRQRIERARALLSDTNETIHDMGKRCGFSSAIRFTTVFKEQVGMTPTEFRKRMVPNAVK